MSKLMNTLPSNLRNWVNGLEALTLSQIQKIEKTWSEELVNYYANGLYTKPEINEAWNTWQQLKANEITYLESA